MPSTWNDAGVAVSGKRNLSRCSTRKPLRLIVMTVSRPVWQPPATRDQIVASTIRWMRRRPGVFRANVFQEAQLLTWGQDSIELSQFGRRVGDRAQQERGHHGVGTAAFCREPVGEAVDHLDGHRHPGGCGT